MPDDAQRKCLGCADLIRHERELREAEFKVLSERLRARDEALKISALELRDKLEQMNAFRDENRRQAVNMVSRVEFDAHVKAQTVQVERTEGEIATAQRAIDRIVTTVSTLRAIVAVVGTPGILAMLWALIAAAANKTVTGPSGLFP